MLEGEHHKSMVLCGVAAACHFDDHGRFEISGMALRGSSCSSCFMFTSGFDKCFAASFVQSLGHYSWCDSLIGSRFQPMLQANFICSVRHMSPPAIPFGVSGTCKMPRVSCQIMQKFMAGSMITFCKSDCSIPRQGWPSFQAYSWAAGFICMKHPA